MTKYLTKEKQLADKKRTSTSPSPTPGKRTRLSNGPPFDWLCQCFYCQQPCNITKDTKNPNRWTAAYLVRETEGKSTAPLEERIKQKCHERGDKWASDILDRLADLAVRASDLHAADARYHRDCYTRFFHDRHPPGQVKTTKLADSAHSALDMLLSEMKCQRSEMWDQRR